MHLGNGAVTPECAAVTLAAAGAGLAVAGWALRRSPIDRQRWLTAGAVSGTLFAAQMVNVPVLPFASAHLVGGVLAAWVLGPALGALAMSVVLLTQAFVLGDGGLAALGANIINMALLPALVVAFAGRRASAARAGSAAGLAVIGAALLIVGEVALFRSAGQLSGWGTFAWQMLATHLWIAVPEGLLTVAILKALGGVRAPGELRLDQTRLSACWACAALLVIGLLPFASRMPDGFEASAERSGMATLVAIDSNLPAGEMNTAIAAWQNTVVSQIQNVLTNEQLLALAGTIVCGLTVSLLARTLRRPTLATR